MSVWDDSCWPWGWDSMKNSSPGWVETDVVRERCCQRTEQRDLCDHVLNAVPPLSCPWRRIIWNLWTCRLHDRGSTQILLTSWHCWLESALALIVVLDCNITTSFSSAHVSVSLELRPQAQKHKSKGILNFLSFVFNFSVKQWMLDELPKVF